MTPILQIENLSVSLPKGADRPFAIQDITFSVNAGEIVCVVGEVALANLSPRSP